MLSNWGFNQVGCGDRARKRTRPTILAVENTLETQPETNSVVCMKFLPLLPLRGSYGLLERGVVVINL